MSSAKSADAADANLAAGSTSQKECREIGSLILTIRGKQVLLDKDVASLYGCELKAMNQTVKRNINRFPLSFRFQLTDDEVSVLRSQNVTAISSMARVNPYVYTEHGIAMLAGILKNPLAERVSVKIINAFIDMRRFFHAQGTMFENISSMQALLLEHDRKLLAQSRQLDSILETFALPKESQDQMIFFEGQFYDAYLWLKGVIKKAKRSITIIDNYANESVLCLLEGKRAKSVSVTVVTKNGNTLDREFVDRWRIQHGSLALVQTNAFHDRFIIVDEVESYCVGASLKDMGKKCFGVFQLKDTDRLTAYVNQIIIESERDAKPDGEAER